MYKRGDSTTAAAFVKKVQRHSGWCGRARVNRGLKTRPFYSAPWVGSAGQIWEPEENEDIDLADAKGNNRKMLAEISVPLSNNIASSYYQ